MVALLNLLEKAIPSDRWRLPMKQGEIVSAIEKRLVTDSATTDVGDAKPDFRVRRRLVERFYRERGWRQNRELLFLNGEFEQRNGGTDRDLVIELLRRAKDAGDEERRLTRLWLAIRELMAAPLGEPKYREFLPFWNEALGQWGAAAAWYGLHAHVFLGGRAALGTLARVRALLRQGPERIADAATVAHPATALASATYSIAKLAPVWLQPWLLREAWEHLNHPADSPRTQANMDMLRGSISLRSGLPWRPAP